VAERAVIPPPPPGFTLDAVPPPPPGFVLDAAGPDRSIPDSAPPAEPQPPDTRTFAQKADAGLTGAVEAGAAMASGLGAQIVGRTAAIGSALMPGNYGSQEGAGRAQALGARVADTLTYRPRSEAGQEILGSVGKAVSASKLEGLGPPEAMLIGQGAPVARRAAALERARQDTQMKLNAPRDADLAKAKASGLTIAPAEANPSLFNRILEGLSGQAKVQQLASEKSKPVVNEIARRGLGIPSDTPLDTDALVAVRKTAAGPYERARALGDIPTDSEYTKALDAIESRYSGAAKSFSEEKDPVQAAVDSARNTVRAGVFDSSDAVDKMKLERSRADKAFAQRDTELGKAHKAIADAVEEQIIRHASEAGDPNLAADLKNARAVIARSYDVQKALKGNDVDARVLYAQLKKGKQLGGELADAANIAGRFKGSFDVGSKNAYTPVNAYDLLLGGGAGLAALAHSPEAVKAAAVGGGIAAGRAGIRAGITSGPYQRLNMRPPSYGLSMNKRLSEAFSSESESGAPLLLQGQKE